MPGNVDEIRRYADRSEAGRVLAEALRRYAGDDSVVVLGLPRGGLPVAWEVARALNAPLDVLTVRKIGVPGHRELAMGAIASGGFRVLDDALIAGLGVPPEAVSAVIAEEERELARRDQLFRSGRPAVPLKDRTVILVDDGLATGSTMRVAVKAVRAQSPRRVVVAAPVGSREACALLSEEADEVVCPSTPWNFRAVGQWYVDFSQTTDDEVVALLERSAART